MSYESEQKLIDIMFEVGLLIHDSPILLDMSTPELADWIAYQLRGCGFDTQPIGASWGSLKK